MTGSMSQYSDQTTWRWWFNAKKTKERHPQKYDVGLSKTNGESFARDLCNPFHVMLWVDPCRVEVAQQKCWLKACPQRANVCVCVPEEHLRQSNIA